MGDHRPNDSDEMTPAEAIDDLLPAYALGILDAADRAEVEAWLGDDATRAAELKSYQVVVERLPLLVEDREPPVGLRQRIMATVTSDTSTDVPAPTPIRPAWYARRAPWVLAASILLAVSIGLGAWNALLRGQLDDQQRLVLQTTAQLNEVKAQVAMLESQPRVAIYTVSGTKDAPNASGEVVYVPQQQAAFLTISNLPPTATDRAYQVWFIEDGKPVSAGLLPTAPNQAAARLNADLSKYQAIAVSLEPAGGSPQPTGPIVVQAPLVPGNA